MTKNSTRFLLVSAICAPGSAQAIDFVAGAWNGSLNTTVSYGQLYRDEKQDPRLIATANLLAGAHLELVAGEIPAPIDEGVEQAHVGVGEVAANTCTAATTCTTPISPRCEIGRAHV